MKLSIKKAPPLPYKFDYYMSSKVSKKAKIKSFHQSNSQQAARNYLAEDLGKRLRYNELTDFLTQKMGLKNCKKTIKFFIPEPKIANKDLDNEEILYNESESPEIVKAFIDMIKSIPISDEQSDSIYSDEELEEF